MSMWCSVRIYPLHFKLMLLLWVFFVFLIWCSIFGLLLCFAPERSVYMSTFLSGSTWAWDLLNSTYIYTGTKEAFNKLCILSPKIFPFLPEVKTKGAKMYVSINTDSRTVTLKAILLLLCSGALFMLCLVVLYAATLLFIAVWSHPLFVLIRTKSD